MDEMKAVDLGHVMSSIKASGRPNTVLWQAPDSIAFVARGREFRSEFHSDPSDEVMYMIKGDMNLYCTWGAGPTLTRGGERRVPRMAVYVAYALCPTR